MLFDFLSKEMIFKIIPQIKNKAVNKIHALAMINKHIVNPIIQKFSKSNIELDFSKTNDFNVSYKIIFI